MLRSLVGSEMCIRDRCNRSQPGNVSLGVHGGGAPLRMLERGTGADCHAWKRARTAELEQARPFWGGELPPWHGTHVRGASRPASTLMLEHGSSEQGMGWTRAPPSSLEQQHASARWGILDERGAAQERMTGEPDSTEYDHYLPMQQMLHDEQWVAYHTRHRHNVAQQQSTWRSQPQFQQSSFQRWQMCPEAPHWPTANVTSPPNSLPGPLQTSAPFPVPSFPVNAGVTFISVTPGLRKADPTA
eukprot:TRINITY_DN8538_c0_g1_i2.p1 TRINITY_DN8538_c0_g1~~TRINITY_DN8538_c0_g1_i2.p1  ORF type:complete len:273 (+),score=38.26 TRINITY_DN8538_c0_g1_i2:90-821(+)